MNKLISKNPIQRFKQGRKIMKCLGGNYIQIDSENDIWQDKSTGKQYQRNWRGRRWNRTPQGTAEGDFSNYFSEYSSAPKINGPKQYSVEDIKALYTEPNTAKRHDYEKGEVEYAQRNGIWYAKWVDPTRPNQGYYRVAEGSTGYDRFGNHNVLRNGQWVKITTPTQKKAVPVNWNQNYDNFKNGLTTAQRAYLSKEGVDYDNVESVQKYLLGKLGNNALGKWGADSKWGGTSQAAWNKFAASIDFTPKVDIQPEQIEKDRQAVINKVLPKPILPTIPQGGISNFKPLSTAKTYNRAGIRDYIRSKGFNPYDYAGYQRKALRMVMNGQGTDEDKAIVKAMGIFKQGGILPSRNIVKRFKNRKFN